MDEIQKKSDKKKVEPFFLGPDSIEAMDVAISSLKQDPERDLTRTKALWVLFFLIAFFNLYEYLLRISPSVMASEVMASYQIKAVDFGRLSSFFYFIYAPMQIGVGMFMDRYGPKYCLPIAVFICGVGTFLFSISQTLGVAQVGRLMMGLGSAFAFVGGLRFIMVNFSPNRFSFLAGLLVSVCLLGGIIGQIILAFFLKWITWRWVCFGMALIGGLLSFLMFKYLHQPQVVKANKMAWKTLFLSVGQIFKNAKIWLMALTACLFYLPTSVFAELWGVSYLKTTYGLSSIEAAYVISMLFVGWAVGCPLLGWMADYFKIYHGLMILGAFVSFVLLSIMLVMPTVFAVNLSFLMFLLGFWGSTQILVVSIVRHYISLDASSISISFLNAFVLMGGFLFQPLVGFLLDQCKQTGVMAAQIGYSPADYQAALFVLPVALLFGVFISLFFYSKPSVLKV